MSAPCDAACRARTSSVLQRDWIVAMNCGSGLPAAVIFERVLGLKTLLFSFSTGDENLHAPDEFFRLSRLDEGVAAWSELFRRLAG